MRWWCKGRAPANGASSRAPERHARARGRRRVACLALLGLACATPAPPTAAPPAPAPPETLPEQAPPVAPPGCERIVGLEVHKSERRLAARCEGGAVLTMTAALGREPEGPKRLVGDLRTPEGSYRIAGPLVPSRFHGFIPFDYPSVADAEAALAAGRISVFDHERIVEAHARGEPPPADTPLGGGIGLHGEGERWRGDSEHLDWTYGCVAVTDRELDFLARRLEPGVPVVIHP